MCRAGDGATLLIGAGNVDAAEFEDADEVRFDRGRNRHVAFGGGPHRCLGSHLARLELHVALEQFHRASPTTRSPRVPRSTSPPASARPSTCRSRSPSPRTGAWSQGNSRARSGATTGSRRRGGRRRGAPPEGAPNIVLVVLDDVGFAQLGCFGSDLDTPMFDALAAARSALPQLPHDRAVLTDAVVPAHRAQPPRERDGPHHRPRHGLPGLRRLHPEGERVPLRDPRAARVRGVGHRQVAPHTRRRAEPGGAARPLAARPRLRAVLRVLRRRDAPERARARPRQPLRRRAARRGRRLPPHRGPRRPRDRVRRTTSGRSTRTSRSSLYLCPGACHSPHHAPPEWIERYHGRFDVGWDVWREQVLAPPDRDGVAAGAHGALGTAGVGSGVGGPHRRRTPRLRALHGGVRGLPVARRPPCRPVPRRAGGHRRSRQHGRDRGVRQRREQRRRRARIVERRTRRGTARRAPSKRRCRSSTRSAARAGTTTTRGAGPSRATRRSAGGSARCTKAVSPIR